MATAVVNGTVKVPLSSARVILMARVKASARWFWWIAGLSLINTIAAMADSKFHFIVGLGFTQLVDGISKKLTGSVGFGALFFDVLFAALFFGFGWVAGKGRDWAFILGMIAYALDALLFLFAKDVIGIGFHLFALWCIYKGLKANEQLTQLASAAQPA